MWHTRLCLDLPPSLLHLWSVRKLHLEAKYKAPPLAGRRGWCLSAGQQPHCEQWSRAMCHLLVPLFLCSSHLRVCPELASQAGYRTADLLLLLNAVGTCLFSLSVVLVCGETETWNRDLQGLLSLLWKKWCLITSWCQRARQASKWTSSENILVNPACLFLPCSRESPRRGFGPAVLPTRLLSRLTYHR